MNIIYENNNFIENLQHEEETSNIKDNKIKNDLVTTITNIDNRLKNIVNNLNDPIQELIEKRNWNSKVGEKLKALAYEIWKLQQNREEKLLIKVNELITKDEINKNDLINFQVLVEQLIEKLKEVNGKIKKNLMLEEVIDKINIEEVTSVKQFYDKIKITIISKIETYYPNSIINQDYKIKFENLNDEDIIQGKEIKIKVEPTKNSIIKNILTFIIKINYQYNAEQQLQAATRILQTAIPENFRNYSSINKEQFLQFKRLNTDYLPITPMISNVKPLSILLSKPHLASKIMVETFAASYWSNYHTSFWGLWILHDHGAWPTETTIPDNFNKIKNVSDLYHLNNTYFNQIFLMIEKYLNESGIKCQVTKKGAKNEEQKIEILFGTGNLQFKQLGNKKRQYYIQVNFEVLFTEETAKTKSKEFAGVVLTLTDELTLYP